MYYWPVVLEEAEQKIGGSSADRFPARDQTAIHRVLFAANIPIVENLSGAVAQFVGRRVHVCAFPWRFAGGEAAFVRVVAFDDHGAGT
jgi:kynurenine formamidase